MRKDYKKHIKNVKKVVYLNFAFPLKFYFPFKYTKVYVIAFEINYDTNNLTKTKKIEDNVCFDIYYCYHNYDNKIVMKRGVRKNYLKLAERVYVYFNIDKIRTKNKNILNK